jgi:hypothetical protein
VLPWSPRVGRHGGALTSSPAAASRRQGSRLEHHRHMVDASGKKSGGGAHRGGPAAVGWREVASAAAFRWEGGSDRVAASSGRSCG